MRTTSISKVFWLLLGVSVLGFGLSSCVDDVDQQQEEQLEEDAEDSSEYGGEEYIEGGEETAGMEEGMESMEDGEPMELGSPVAEEAEMDMGLAAGEDTSMPEPVANSLEGVAEDQSAQLGGDAGSSESFQYTIVKGDWLSKIAQRVYGDMYKWPLIANANTQIKNPNLIYPDNVISVPIIDDKSREFSQSYAQNDTINVDSQFVSIKIEKGETLSKIAKRMFGKTGQWKKIWEANKANIQDPNVVTVGQIVKVPVLEGMGSEDFTKVAQL